VANHEVKIKVALQNMTQRGMSAVTRSLSRLKMHALAVMSSMRRASVSAIRAMTFGFAALIGSAAMTVRSFMKQQDAVEELASAFRNNGEDAAALVPKYQRLAAALQQQTKYGDEALLTQMAYLRNLGVAESKLESATKAAIGLAHAYKLDLQTAMMLVGRASQGQTQMLTRYGIVLDDSLNDQEKFNAILKIGADKFVLAKDAAQTLRGRLVQLKNAFGDLLEKVGQQIAEGMKLDQLFVRMKKSVENLIDRLQKSGAIEKFANNARKALESVLDIANALSDAETRGPTFEALGNVIVAFFKLGAASAADLLLDVAPKIGRRISAGFAELISTLFPASDGKMAEMLAKPFKNLIAKAAGSNNDRTFLRDAKSEASAALNALAALTDRAKEKTQPAQANSAAQIKEDDLLWPFKRRQQGRRLENVSYATTPKRKRQKSVAAQMREIMHSDDPKFADAKSKIQKMIWDSLTPKQQLNRVKAEFNGLNKQKGPLTPERAERMLELAELGKSLTQSIKEHKNSLLSQNEGLRKQAEALKKPTRAEIGISQYFDWMRAVKSGKSPDQTIAENTTQMRDLLRQINKNIAEGGLY
jgi:hypothetical protein